MDYRGHVDPMGYFIIARGRVMFATIAIFCRLEIGLFAGRVLIVLFLSRVVPSLLWIHYFVL